MIQQKFYSNRNSNIDPNFLSRKITMGFKDHGGPSIPVIIQNLNR